MTDKPVLGAGLVGAHELCLRRGVDMSETPSTTLLPGIGALTGLADDPRPSFAASIADELNAVDKWRRRNPYYYRQIHRLFKHHTEPGTRVLEVGCGLGHLLADVQPSRGVGIESKPRIAELAAHAHPQLEIICASYENFRLEETFDYVLLANPLGEIHDIQAALESIKRVCRPETRLVLMSFNALWEPILELAGLLRQRQKVPAQNWLSTGDVANLLDLAGFEMVRTSPEILFPKYVPLLSGFLNRLVSKLWPFTCLPLAYLFVARPRVRPPDADQLTCSVIVPTHNERGNIAAVFERTPRMGAGTELIFVDGHSTDGTPDEIRRLIALHPERDAILIDQGAGRGKGDAVRRGFAAARGDVLIILDADLTVPPEDLPKFFQALRSGRGEFINGTRLVYPLQEHAMRFLNKCANQFFSALFSWLLNQRFRDTLCGTKALRRRDYLRIAAAREYLGTLDPFGDFDLIFGATRADLKTMEIPVRYAARTYGQTSINRFRDGWLLLRMSWHAFWKLKMR